MQMGLPKINPDGSTRYKTRLVIKGYAQKEGIDYDEKYVLVTKNNNLSTPIGTLSGIRTKKQAPRLWYEDINGYLQSIRFQQSAEDPNLYLQPRVLLILYVDVCW
jgi:hypothetical protein